MYITLGRTALQVENAQRVKCTNNGRNIVGGFKIVLGSEQYLQLPQRLQRINIGQLQLFYVQHLQMVLWKVNFEKKVL